MSLEGDIRTALLAMNAVTALTGSAARSARIRPYALQAIDDRLEEHIIIEVDATPRQNTLDGAGAMILADVNLSCRALTRAEASALAQAVKTNGTSLGTGFAWYGGSGTAFHAWIEDETPSLIHWKDGTKERVWHTIELSMKAQYSEAV
jgi:hypothetical protein